MNFILLGFPYIVSFLIGYFLISLFFQKEKISFGLHFFLAGGLGLAVSAQLTFTSFLLFNHLNKPFVVMINLLTLDILMVWALFVGALKNPSAWNLRNFSWINTLGIAAILIGLIPLILEANLYPLGGWDAWSLWNLKSKFLFLGGESWKNIFDPLLWRSSPHYPLLLPLINTWGWSLSDTPGFQIPYLTAFSFTFLAAGLLGSSLQDLTKKSILLFVCAPLLMLSSLFFIKLATSQYADIVFAYYLLAGLVCLIKAKLDGSKEFQVLSGIFVGILSFTKAEGLIAALILILLTLPVLKEKGSRTGFLIGLAFFLWPSIVFNLFYAPANQTFINGLLSADHPSNLLRLKMIAIFLAVELVSSKWHGLWILLTVGLLISKGKCFKGAIKIIPLFLAIYALTVGAYYFTNTYFEITWWLQVSLNRILFAILPTAVFWVLYSMIGETRLKDG